MSWINFDLSSHFSIFKFLPFRLPIERNLLLEWLNCLLQEILIEKKEDFCKSNRKKISKKLIQSQAEVPQKNQHLPHSTQDITLGQLA